MIKKFDYLPGLIPVILFEYFFIVTAITYYHYCICRYRKFNVVTKNVDTMPDEVNKTSRIIPEFEFRSTYESATPRLRYLLFCTRLLSFLYIFCVSVATNYAVQGGFQWFYFTVWNVELLSIYYLLAICASIMGFVYDKDNHLYSPSLIDSEKTVVQWSTHTIRFGHILTALFAVCGGTAILVTLVAFILLNPLFVFWNVSEHLIPILTLLLELSLNNMYVRFDHLRYNLTWAFLYLIFIWPVVVLGNISFWPYSFLALDSFTCFFWYTGLVIIDVICFSIFYGFSNLKALLRDEFARRSLGIIQNKSEQNGNDVELGYNEKSTNEKYEQKEIDESKEMAEVSDADTEVSIRIADLPFEHS